jgi:hypothetical protein
MVCGAVGGGICGDVVRDRPLLYEFPAPYDPLTPNPDGALLPQHPYSLEKIRLGNWVGPHIASRLKGRSILRRKARACDPGENRRTISPCTDSVVYAEWGRVTFWVCDSEPITFVQDDAAKDELFWDR